MPSPTIDPQSNLDTMSQFPIYDFQIDLAPTPEPLTNVNSVLGSAIETVVQTKMLHVFPDSFEYMYVANSRQVDYHANNRQRRRYLQQTTTPSTSVIFNGGVVAFDATPTRNVKALVQSSIESDLVQVLVKQGGPWAYIQQATFIDLSGNAPPTAAPTIASSPQPSILQTPGTLAPESSTVAGLQGQHSYPTVGGGGGGGGTVSMLATHKPQVAAGGFFGVVLLLLAMGLLVRHTKRRRAVRHQDDLNLALDQAETSNVTNHHHHHQKKGRSSKELTAATKKFNRPHKSSSHESTSTAPFVFEDDDDDDDENADDQSEMAQYASNSSSGGVAGDGTDTISVGPSVASSEWTLANSDMSGGGSTIQQLSPKQRQQQQQQQQQLSPSSNPSSAAAMAYASNETFERDRLVTLQKDMLQSEWTHDPVSRHATAATSTAILAPPVRPRSKASPGKVSFYHAHDEDGQGEEVYLMPPKKTPSESFDEDDCLV